MDEGKRVKQLETRLQHCLLRAGLTKLDQVALLTDAELLGVFMLGKQALALARKKYGNFLFDLRGDHIVTVSHDPKHYTIRFSIEPKGY